MCFFYTNFIKLFSVRRVRGEGTADMPIQDPKGYYGVLGLGVSASAAEIKSTYRRLAKELHPDLNQSKDTTAAFQSVQEAYDVLGDDNLRIQYDTFGAIPPSQADDFDRGGGHIEPIRCSRCDCITAQPRLKVFYVIISYLYGAYKKPLQGIFCSSCELKAALKATIGTLLLGWWSIPGFFWTVHALFSNLIGGRFHAPNAFLQGQQAFYFAQEGNLEIAGATAQGAIELIDKARGSGSSHGEEEDLSSFRAALDKLLQTLPPNSRGKTFNNSDGFRSRRFVVQAVIIASFATIISALVVVDQREQQAREATRLEQEGLVKAQADAIAAEQEAALKAMKKPLPKSGVHRSLFGKSRGDWPPFRINNGPGENALIKLVRESDGVEVISIFVRAGETVDVAVPLGSYRVKIAAGQTWYGDEIRFGPKTHYGKFSSIFDFRVDGSELAGHEVSLSRVANGNLQKLDIDANQF